MSDTLKLGKEELIERAKKQMEEHLHASHWTLREKVALTCRVLFAQGHDSGLAGQISARAEQDNTFYTQRFGLGFDEISARNLVLVDQNLDVLDGQGMANPANRFHTWIYNRRPDVHCIIHTHPLHVSALSMLGKPLVVSHMDTCLLHDEVAFLPEWPGVPVGNSEGEIISRTLGKKRVALLAHHGLVVAATSIEEACMLAIQCERAAKLQLLAESAGNIQPIDDTLAREAHDWVLQEKRSQAGFAYFARRVLRECTSHGDSPIA